MRRLCLATHSHDEEPLMKSFTRDACKLLRDEIDAALQAVAKKHGITLKVGNASFDANQINFKLNAMTLGEGGEVVTPEKKAFIADAHFYGFKAEDLGRTFMSNGKTFTIAGLKHANRKMPIIATSEGKSYKFAVDAVKRALGMPVTPTFS